MTEFEPLSPTNTMTLIIGITGGIASGKSTLARMFAGRGVMHVDADKLVHDLLRHDRDTIAEIAAAFPDAVIASKAKQSSVERLRDNTSYYEQKTWIASALRGPRNDGESINRAALAAHIAQQPQDLSKLEAILHPRVRAAELAAIRHAQRNRLRAVILDVPLLFETEAHLLCDVVVVAHAPLALRRRRAFRRAGMSEAKWEKLLARQMTDHHEHPAATIVLSTALGKAALRREVDGLMKRWGLK